LQVSLCELLSALVLPLHSSHNLRKWTSKFSPWFEMMLLIIHTILLYISCLIWFMAYCMFNLIYGLLFHCCGLYVI
jgi:hypothetical protein